MAGLLAVLSSGGDDGSSGLEAAAGLATVAALLVAAAGLVDDLAPERARGLRGHARALVEGHVTTGLLKVVVATGCAVVAVVAAPERGWWVRIAGVALIAGSSNLWNGLDVVPGRALKAFLMVTVLALAADLARPVSWAPAAPVFGAFVIGLPALALDLRERAMLGDAGADLIGFLAGIALFTALPDAGVLIVAIVVVGLDLVAETVSLTRVIQAAPPLRWFDRLGRLPI